MTGEPLDPLTADDESYRICAECGRDCEPVPMPTDLGTRLSWICPLHGVHSVTDPFESDR